MSMKHLWMVVTLATFIGVAQAKADTLDSYVEKLAKHPQVTQILEQSTRFKELAIGELGLPDPQLIIGLDNVPISNPEFDRFLPTSKVFGFKQQIPSYSLRKAKSDKQETLSKRQQLIADYTRQRLGAILITQLAELDKVRRIEKLAKQQLGYYRSMESDLKGQLEAGKPVYGRFSEIDVERTEVEQRLNDLKVERTTIEEELIRLVGKVPEVKLPSISDIEWNRQAELLYPVLISRENINVAAKNVDAADAASDPNYGIQAIYKQREDGRSFSGDDWFSIQATVSIPLWYASNQKPKARAAQAGKRSAEFAYNDTQRNWIKRMAVLKSERDIAMDNIELLKERKASLRQVVRAANRNYESGNAPLETVLSAQIDELTIASQLAVMNSLHIRLSAQFNSHIIGRHQNEND